MPQKNLKSVFPLLFHFNAINFHLMRKLSVIKSFVNETNENKWECLKEGESIWSSYQYLCTSNFIIADIICLSLLFWILMTKRRNFDARVKILHLIVKIRDLTWKFKLKFFSTLRTSFRVFLFFTIACYRAAISQ